MPQFSARVLKRSQAPRWPPQWHVADWGLRNLKVEKAQVSDSCQLARLQYPYQHSPHCTHMILFDEKIELQTSPDGHAQSTTPDDGHQKATTTPDPDVPTLTSPPPTAAGLLRYYLKLHDQRHNSPDHQTTKYSMHIPTSDPPPYEFSTPTRDNSSLSPRSRPLRERPEDTKSLPPIPAHPRPNLSSNPYATLPSRSTSTPLPTPSAVPRYYSRSASLPLCDPLHTSPTARVFSATPFTHLGNRNLSVTREQTGIQGNYVINTDMHSPSKGAEATDLLLQTKRGDVDASVSFIGTTKQFGLCRMVASSLNGNVKLAFGERSTPQKMHLHIEARSLQNGNVQFHLPPNFAGVLRITTPTSKFAPPVNWSPSLSNSSNLILVSETTDNGCRRAEYFYGDASDAADYFLELPGGGQRFWEGDVAELEARSGRVLVFSHGEGVPDGWLTSCRKALGRWFGLGRIP